MELVRTKQIFFFFRIGWAAGAEGDLSETIKNPSKGVACLTVTAQHALHLAEAHSFVALGKHRFLTHINLPAWLKVTYVPPGWSPPEHHAQPGEKQDPMVRSSTLHHSRSQWHPASSPFQVELMAL